VTRLSHLGELLASDQQPRHYKLFSVLQTMTMFTLLHNRRGCKICGQFLVAIICNNIYPSSPL